MNTQNIHPSWVNLLNSEFEKPYFKRIENALLADKKDAKIIYPNENQIFEAFILTPFSEVKVVILGQDPYHGEGEANGLCFSVNEGVKIPPSLRNIFKELSTDITGFEKPIHGNLQNWAKLGILLLNTSLTVIKDQANSHSKIGWQQFTNKIIESVSNQNDKVVFILWGKNAHDKMEFINPTKHLIIKSVHPSPLSASRGFFGSKPFSKTNEYLMANYKTPIDWNL